MLQQEQWEDANSHTMYMYLTNGKKLGCVVLLCLSFSFSLSERLSIHVCTVHMYDTYIHVHVYRQWDPIRTVGVSVSMCTMKICEESVHSQAHSVRCIHHACNGNFD